MPALLFTIFAIAQLVAAFQGASHFLNSGFGAAVALSLAMLTRASFLIPVASFYGAWRVWDWHPAIAIFFAAPGLILIVISLIDQAGLPSFLLQTKSLLTSCWTGLKAKVQQSFGLKINAQNFSIALLALFFVVGFVGDWWLKQSKAAPLSPTSESTSEVSRPPPPVKTLSPLEILADQAERGDTASQLKLALHYYRGEAVPINKEQAYFWFSKSAHLGDPRAMSWVGKMLLEGDGVTEDAKMARQFFHQAYEAGDRTSAPWGLFLIYKNGRGVDRNPTEAYKWARILAEQGALLPSNYVALSLLHGIGVTQNIDEAREWIEKIALMNPSFDGLEELRASYSKVKKINSPACQQAEAVFQNAKERRTSDLNSKCYAPNNDQNRYGPSEDTVVCMNQINRRIDALYEKMINACGKIDSNFSREWSLKSN